MTTFQIEHANTATLRADLMAAKQERARATYATKVMYVRKIMALERELAVREAAARMEVK